MKGIACLKTLLASGLVLLVMMLSSNLTAKIFQWVDEDGKKHFSDKPRNNLFVGKSKPRPGFNALEPDGLTTEEKLKQLQGQWQQTQSSPSHEEITNLLASLWNMSSKRQPELMDMDTILTIESKHITIESKPGGKTVKDNTYQEQSPQTHNGKLEFYNEKPLEIDGFWSFDQAPNPFIMSFLEQVRMPNNKLKTSQQVRFDIQGNQLMITVNLPDDFRVKQLKILYKRQESSSPAITSPP
ncbi:DUF4124 domain-containing protein [Endozoicomonas sp. Mp262]|uniref:DUF4124 domain-containing protein n=1 Tax=Endozoicomonas sp. Mp262 TaxID=2919499 RepID=UPI0021DAB05E